MMSTSVYGVPRPTVQGERGPLSKLLARRCRTPRSLRDSSHGEGKQLVGLSGWGRLRQKCRHREGETGPAVLTVLGPDASPLRLDDVAGDGEPQARSAALARHVDLVETLKHTRLLTVGDAGSRVRDAERDGPASGLGVGTHDN